MPILGDDVANMGGIKVIGRDPPQAGGSAAFYGGGNPRGGGGEGHSSERDIQDLGPPMLVPGTPHGAPDPDVGNPSITAPTFAFGGQSPTMPAGGEDFMERIHRWVACAKNCARTADRLANTAGATAGGAVVGGQVAGVQGVFMGAGLGLLFGGLAGDLSDNELEGALIGGLSRAYGPNPVAGSIGRSAGTFLNNVTHGSDNAPFQRYPQIAIVGGAFGAVVANAIVRGATGVMRAARFGAVGGAAYAAAYVAVFMAVNDNCQEQECGPPPGT